LCQRQEEFSQLNTRVVIISFGTLPGLQAWMNETCNSFEVLLDPERVVYRTYQLDSSRLRSWTPRTVWMFAKLLLAGRKWLPKEGDTSQLGGDFIIDSQGSLRLAYRSYDPADRPSVDSLLKVIREIRLSRD
jgi:peroxiredoxin